MTSPEFRPNAVRVLSPADKELMDKGGLAVVECSWARLSEIPFSKIASPHERLRAFSHPITDLPFAAKKEPLI
jgi:ribosome biogenesis protein Tsr3